MLFGLVFRLSEIVWSCVNGLCFVCLCGVCLRVLYVCVVLRVFFCVLVCLCG